MVACSPASTMRVPVCHDPPRGSLVVTGALFALDYLAGIRGLPGRQNPGSASPRPAPEAVIEEIRSPEAADCPRRSSPDQAGALPGSLPLHGGDRPDWHEIDAAAARYLSAGGAPGSDLVAAALAWRTSPPATDVAAAALLREQMVPLYLRLHRRPRRTPGNSLARPSSPSVSGLAPPSRPLAGVRERLDSLLSKQASGGEGWQT